MNTYMQTYVYLHFKAICGQVSDFFTSRYTNFKSVLFSLNNLNSQRFVSKIICI